MLSDGSGHDGGGGGSICPMEEERGKFGGSSLGQRELAISEEGVAISAVQEVVSEKEVGERTQARI